MTKQDDEAMERRRAAIFKAGAEATTTYPWYEGYRLGSMERCTFFDGYASTHPEFRNPYRRTT